MTDKNEGPNTEPEDSDDEKKKTDHTQMIKFSQYGYTVPIGACLGGYIGHLIGTHILGGSPWDLILMLSFGLIMLVGGFWSMISAANKMMKDAEEARRKKEAEEAARNPEGRETEHPQHPPHDMYDDEDEDD